MMRVTFTEAADADLDDVWLYVARDSITAADRLTDRLIEVAKPLRDFPDMGGARDELSPGLRAVRVGPYLMFYRRRVDGVTIERILHGSRDIQGDLF